MFNKFEILLHKEFIDIILISAKDQHSQELERNFFEQDSQNFDDFVVLKNGQSYSDDVFADENNCRKVEDGLGKILKKDSTTQTLISKNTDTKNISIESVAVQTLNLHADVECESIKDANYHFGMFVARELSHVPPIKRRSIMWEIIRVIEHRST